MDHRLEIALHLDAFDLVVGYGYTLWTNDGEKLTIWAAAPPEPMLPEEAAHAVARGAVAWLAERGHQMQLAL